MLRSRVPTYRNHLRLILRIDFSQLVSYAELAKWLDVPVFEIAVIEESNVLILNRISVLPKPQMIWFRFFFTLKTLLSSDAKFPSQIYCNKMVIILFFIRQNPIHSFCFFALHTIEVYRNIGTFKCEKGNAVEKELAEVRFYFCFGVF